MKQNPESQEIKLHITLFLSPVLIIIRGGRLYDLMHRYISRVSATSSYQISYKCYTILWDGNLL